MNPQARVAVIGASGQLGSDLVEALRQPGFECLTPSHAELDVCDHAHTASILKALQPSVIVNLTAFHKVEACEADPERAFAVNCHAVHRLAEVAESLEALLVHISTDYVFGGEQMTPYAEESLPLPRQVYGVSKLAGEHLVRHQSPRHLVIRSSGLYGKRGSSGKGGNFVETMLERGRQGPVKVVTDQVLSPTSTRDLSEMIVRLIRADVSGLVHVTNSGSCSWYEFAREIFAISGNPVEVIPVATHMMPSSVVRPRYSVLDNKRLRDEGFPALRPWQNAVASYLHQPVETLVANR
jgi:dTDP-4-dehydrorhamnose reductase